MKALLAEVFAEFAECTTDDERVRYLRENQAEDVRLVLRAAFHPKIRFLVDSVPKYKPLRVPAGMAGNTITQELRRLYLFEVGNPRCPKNLTPKRREELLIQVLESLEAEEATVWMNMLLKKLRVPGLTKEIVDRAFPDLMKD